MKNVVLPGLIDMHVHLRDPGQTNKEDFYTGTQAALAGGFTTVFDMPNNLKPITTLERLKIKEKRAKSLAVCDVGLYFGSLGDNIEEFEKVKDLVWGVKLYLNPTTGDYRINIHILERVFSTWPKNKFILVHAEEDVIGEVIEAARKYERRVHVCHVSSQSELEPILKAKQDGLHITCGVTPHHLFLTEADEKTLGPYGRMKPSLKTKQDQDFLWKNIGTIDVVESDHAPHTKAEKESASVPFGVPGLETTLPLLLTAVHENKITLDEVVRLCHTNPAKILGLIPDPETKIIIDLDTEYSIQNTELFTKSGWSPFHRRKVRGKLKEVYIEGVKVFEGGRVLRAKGQGRVILPTS